MNSWTPPSRYVTVEPREGVGEVLGLVAASYLVVVRWSNGDEVQYPRRGVTWVTSDGTPLAP